MDATQLEVILRRCAHIDVDHNGLVVKKVSAKTIKTSWRPAVDAVLDIALERCGDRLDSLYVLGSAARGTAKDGISDLDMVAITTTDVLIGTSLWNSGIGSGIVQRFPFVARLELISRTCADIEVMQGLRWLLKLHCVCIHGSDRSDDIPAYRFGPDVAHYRRSIQKDLRASIARMSRVSGLQDTSVHCEWVTKRILRVGFELVMERVGTLTSDSDACCECFCAYYPEKAGLMRCVLELAKRPVQQPAAILAVVSSFVEWLPAEVFRVFGESDVAGDRAMV